MNKGVSLISLIVTIIVIIILAGITIFSSLDTVDDANIVKRKTELNNVTTWVRNTSSKVMAEQINIDLPEDMLVTNTQMNEFFINGAETDFTGSDADKIKSMNESVKDNEIASKYGYYYLTGAQIENGVPGIDESIELEKVENNYIVNFYYGTVIAKVSDTEVIVNGKIK